MLPQFIALNYWRVWFYFIYYPKKSPYLARGCSAGLEMP